jgi:hypothetical protein
MRSNKRSRSRLPIKRQDIVRAVAVGPAQRHAVFVDSFLDAAVGTRR